MTGRATIFIRGNEMEGSEAHEFGSQMRSIPSARSFEPGLTGVSKVN